MDALNSKIFRGEVYHERLVPRGHAFTYPVTFFAFDLAELSALAQNSLLFAHNRFGPLSLHDSDYLLGQHRAITAQLDSFIPPQASEASTILITSHATSVSPSIPSISTCGCTVPNSKTP